MVIAAYWVTTSWHYLVGYTYSLVGGAAALGYLMPRLYRELPSDPDQPEYKSALPRRVGFVERGIYTSAWVTGHPAFIAVWLGLKTVQRSFGMSKTDERSLDLFNLYLIGNAFSLAFGVLGGLAIKWFANDHSVRAVVVLVVAFVASLLYGRLAGSNPPEPLPDTPAVGPAPGAMG